MFQSKISLVIALALAVGIPVLATNKALRDRLTSSFSSSGSSDFDEPALNIASQVPDPNRPEHSIRNHVNTPETSLLFTPTVQDFRDVFRFDVTPNWVKSRWPRVSACGYVDGMEGFRVPLVTGTQPSDLHGSLTFFFDDEHVVQRIGFFGYCGDANRIVEMAMNHFGFQAKSTHNAGLYVRTYMGKPVGALRIISAAVVRADQPQNQLQVTFEVNNPGGPFRMSDGFVQLLEGDRRPSAK